MSNRDPYSDWIRFGVTVARLRAPHLWPKWLHAGPCGDLVSPQKTLRASRITGCESVPRDAALSKRSERTASPQSACCLGERRKLGTRCLILDEFPFPAAFRKFVTVVAREEDSLQKSFATVSNENKVGLLALLVRIAWKRHCELVLFCVAAAQGKNSGMQLLEGVAACFQRCTSYCEIERYVC